MEININIAKIHDELEQLLKKSYCPYSKFHVACIVQDEYDNFFYGVNVENVSFGATICAERTAVANAITSGSKKIKMLYLMTSSENFVPPCGICLQFISEFMLPDSSIVIFDSENRYKILKLKNLIPHIFHKKELINE